MTVTELERVYWSITFTIATIIQGHNIYTTHITVRLDTLTQKLHFQNKNSSIQVSKSEILLKGIIKIKIILGIVLCRHRN